MRLVLVGKREKNGLVVVANPYLLIVVMLLMLDLNVKILRGRKMSKFEIIKAVPLPETKRLKYLKYLLNKEINDPYGTQSYIDDLKESIRQEEIQRDKMYLYSIIKDNVED